MRDRASGARGQQLQLAIAVDGEPLDDRVRQDALALPGGADGITLRVQFDRRLVVGDQRDL